ncbi:GNAT family N-acetyltransferase [Peribacillus sp. SCS-37]|uniref:GNAT family N-acetyltransferase n=1 Tax=Paraperibacillus esterisolvens TaxID=3115296 RepID=UPI003905F74C
MVWRLKKFNELTSIELYNILQERTRVFVVEQDCPYLEVDGKDLEAYHLFKEKDSEIMAYLRVLPPGVSYPQASLGRVMVKEEYRGEGLAKELVAKGLEVIRQELGESAVKIQAQNYLNKFYGSFGFQAVSEIYLEDNIPHIDMVLKIETEKSRL